MRSRSRLLLLRLQLGRRGAILVCLGALYLLYGYGLLVEPMVNTVSLRMLFDLWPQRVWAWLWIGAGAAAVACAWLRQGRDWLGFTLLYPLAAAWGLSSLVSWWPNGDNPRGWIAAAIWCALGGVITTAAGWDEPSRKKGGSDGER